MPLPQQVPDLPDKIAQRAAWEQAQKQAGRESAKELVSWANYTPLVVVVPLFNWIIDNWPDWAMRSADGRDEAEFHHYGPKAEFSRSKPEQFMLIDGEVWYFTRRGQRPCDIGFDLAGLDLKDSWAGWLFQAQPQAFQAALPWRVKLWEDTELPANVPLRLPAWWVAAAIKKYRLPLMQAPTMQNSQAWGLKPGARMPGESKRGYAGPMTATSRAGSGKVATPGGASSEASLAQPAGGLLLIMGAGAVALWVASRSRR